MKYEFNPDDAAFISENGETIPGKVKVVKISASGVSYDVDTAGGIVEVPEGSLFREIVSAPKEAIYLKPIAEDGYRYRSVGPKYFDVYKVKGAKMRIVRETKDPYDSYAEVDFGDFLGCLSVKNASSLGLPIPHTKGDGFFDFRNKELDRLFVRANKIKDQICSKIKADVKAGAGRGSESVRAVKETQELLLEINPDIANTFSTLDDYPELRGMKVAKGVANNSQYLNSHEEIKGGLVEIVHPTLGEVVAKVSPYKTVKWPDLKMMPEYHIYKMESFQEVGQDNIGRCAACALDISRQVILQEVSGCWYPSNAFWDGWEGSRSYPGLSSKEKAVLLAAMAAVEREEGNV